MITGRIAVVVAVLAAVALVPAGFVGCADRTRQQTAREPHPEGVAEAPAGAEPGAAEPGEAAASTVDRHGGSGQGSGQPARDTASVATNAEVGPDAGAAPPDIFEVMSAAGFALETEQDLADYLPVPPRSEGQVGRFVLAGETVTVARVTYPAPEFADPHENWIRERMRLIPDSHERVVRRGATVIHIRADSSAQADAVMGLFSAWAGPAEPGEDGT